MHLHCRRRGGEAGARRSTTRFLVIGLCEAACVINLAFMAVLVFALA